MNGNFEYDRGAYPYAGVQVGDLNKLMHVPTMQCILDVRLPRAVAVHAAIRLNAKHYAAKAGGPEFKSDLQTVKDITSQALTHCVQTHIIDGPNATQLQLLIDAATR